MNDSELTTTIISETVQEQKESNMNNTKISSEPVESLEAIRKYIEAQERELQDLEKDKKKTHSTEHEPPSLSVIESDVVASTSSLMDMLINETDDKLINKNNKSEISKSNQSPLDKGNSSVALSVGSKVEARDFAYNWHPALITEVDFEEMEVLVHYDQDLKGVLKPDEWISVNSPRLRPFGMVTKSASGTEENTKVLKEEPHEVKLEEKSKVVYAVGERCLARWRDNRRFMATIQKDLGNGAYEIIFDDGFLWKCTTTRLYKWKPGKHDTLTVDTNMPSPTTSASSPIQTGGPINSNAPSTPVFFNNHLFDPKRDYLSSKSERREMKRKLNIKEIFNIGQKRQKIPKDKDKEKVPTVRKPRILKKRRNMKPGPVKVETTKAVNQNEIPDAVASIIGTLKKEESQDPEATSEGVTENETRSNVDAAKVESNDCDNVSKPVDTRKQIYSFDSDEYKLDFDPVLKEEVKLEKFEKIDDSKHEEVIDRIKEVINKLEDGLNNVDKPLTPKPFILKPSTPKSSVPKPPTPKPTTPKPETTALEPPTTNNSEQSGEQMLAAEELRVEEVVDVVENTEKLPVESDSTTSMANVKDKPKKLSKIKKGKKLRLLQEKKVKKQVEKVKSELEVMKKQMKQMRKEMLLKTQQLASGAQMPESFMLPGEWCCKWVDGQPLGTVSEIPCEVKLDGDGKPGLPRRSVQVEDKRLPPGWTKHMVRRSLGHSAGKWDVVLVSPNNRRFHTKTDMRNFLENNADVSLKAHENALMDFGLHLKLSSRLGWITHTPEGVAEGPTLPSGLLSITSPIVKKNKKFSPNKDGKKEKKKKRFTLKLKIPRFKLSQNEDMKPDEDVTSCEPSSYASGADAPLNDPALEPLEDGYVYVGSLKVQISDNLLKCPAEGCYKNFRNSALLQMHIKHYHRELKKMLGATPKVLDLAYARTKPVRGQVKKKPKRPRVLKPKRLEPKAEAFEMKPDALESAPVTPDSTESFLKLQDSPKLRDALVSKPVKRPRVLLPVRRPEDQASNEEVLQDSESDLVGAQTPILDFETAISTHTVTKPLLEKLKRAHNRKFASVSQKQSEDEDWFMGTSDVDTRSSFPGSGTPDSKSTDVKQHQPVSSESNNEEKDNNMYMYNESGERIKIVHMKREEIINCHCGFREEDGLMVQCELCLCWQHALCHNIQSESQVPEKYTCSICLNPRRGRRSRRFAHEQELEFQGRAAGGRPLGALRRAHELSGNLLRLRDSLHALALHYHVALKKNHPKLYLWAKDWDQAEVAQTQGKFNSDYSDLNIMISALGKENLPIKPEDVRDLQMDVRLTPGEEDGDRFLQRDSQAAPTAMLGGMLSSPGGTSLDLPISTSELEKLAKSVEEQELVRAPQPEAAIDNNVCRERLLRHITCCQALLDARLDSIEAQVAELESQDPSFEDDETPDYFPRTKQTVQMLLRDLDTMEELALVT
ncbi:PHD finger protein 20 isoform X2 [Bombyx mori]|nr:PHD finger protein 20 isoform X3 [Bombyx mori]XP_037871686.1 PHD finger protein 20 isoform X3 [Bombyx mori]XP_037871687.1 PHD finger protein 20 isoform X3 [Bombyx mori]XP_037871688.1 PHD finger protein 20 isoform X3 [Bombyx mori]XP_037871689.1 PHD finger protein 20 isoform X3 [Bombyx mori]XP_037871690.1 PHD finger protein 20 isoform X3 [Bombyx mori]